MDDWLVNQLQKGINLPLQELKIRKGGGGRGKREAGEEVDEGDCVDEGDFGFVEVWNQIVLKHEVEIL